MALPPLNDEDTEPKRPIWEYKEPKEEKAPVYYAVIPELDTPSPPRIIHRTLPLSAAHEPEKLSHSMAEMQLTADLAFGKGAKKVEFRYDPENGKPQIFIPINSDAEAKAYTAKRNLVCQMSGDIPLHTTDQSKPSKSLHPPATQKEMAKSLSQAKQGMESKMVELQQAMVQRETQKACESLRNATITPVTEASTPLPGSRAPSRGHAIA